MRNATASDILDLLREGSFQAALALSPALMTVPMDSKGARLRVAVLKDIVDQVPEAITMTLQGEEILVPLEVVELHKDPD